MLFIHKSIPNYFQIFFRWQNSKPVSETFEEKWLFISHLQWNISAFVTCCTCTCEIKNIKTKQTDDIKNISLFFTLSKENSFLIHIKQILFFHRFRVHALRLPHIKKYFKVSCMCTEHMHFLMPSFPTYHNIPAIYIALTLCELYVILRWFKYRG